MFLSCSSSVKFAEAVTGMVHNGVAVLCHTYSCIRDCRFESVGTVALHFLGYLRHLCRIVDSD